MDKNSTEASSSHKGKSKSHWSKTIKNECTRPQSYSFYSNQIPIGPGNATSLPPNSDKRDLLSFRMFYADSPSIPLRTSNGRLVNSVLDLKKATPPAEAPKPKKVVISNNKMNLYGFPTPGNQSPEVKSVMNSGD
eukprot:TRINITY_DN4673_c0_g1_i2.p2 TRINITY_DN4673_c0_g1~~TRINITY_DN4673_c0_g1_i2.p2  ORF type:complete len:135 (-),score=14.96 TRINITY_DN4673_c0_g1_i2:460-864(-)